MNQASEWRLEYGRYVGRAYMAVPAVAAVMVSGSAGRGHADQYADVDMGVFWQRPPTEAERGRIAERIVADTKRIYPFDAGYQVWGDDYLPGRSAAEVEQSGQCVEWLRMVFRWERPVWEDEGPPFGTQLISV